MTHKRSFPRFGRRIFFMGVGALVNLGIIQHKRSWATPSSDICWRSPEELVTIGFERSRVVMMNEAHSGAERNIRSRKIGRRILPTANALGVRHIAMEALPISVSNEANSTRKLPIRPENSTDYLAQPEMRAFIQKALDLSWTLIPYEIDIEKYPSKDPLSWEFNNLRERVQAENLAHALQELPSNAKLLVWCGNSHHLKKIVKIGDDELILMGYHFVQLSGIEHFVIDQTLSINWDGDLGQQNRFASLMTDLVQRGGTAGFLVEEVPPGLSLDNKKVKEVMDAVILSTENELE
ncbi:hypothetical protein IQ243_00160 [Nostocales cyanobacterium LEGE 11386]|nr:hypothetical protein [Nostocales cyanobacterium LEGE 11386]